MLTFSEIKARLLGNLQNNILIFWDKNAVDDYHGGFIGQVDSENRQVEKANKGIILNTRILWFYSSVYFSFRNDRHITLAHRAYQYLYDHFRDTLYGGLYWELNYLGEPINKRKQIYAQVFTIYALVAYYEITRSKEALEWAVEIYRLIERYSYDPGSGAYIEAFSQNWSSVTDYRLSEKDLNAPFTLNTHLHILEAYTSLYKTWKDKNLKTALEKLIHLFINRFPGTHGHLVLFFNRAWEPLQHIYSFGHEIEFSWLLTEAAGALRIKNLMTACKKEALRIVNLVIGEGYDNQNGGIIYEYDGNQQRADTDKHWWPQAEALVSFLNAYQLTGVRTYLDLFLETWNFIDNYLVDHEHGEWYWKVNKDGKVYPGIEKAGFWKCPYHNSRAILETLKRIDKINPT